MKKITEKAPEKTISEKMLEAFELPKNKSGIVTALHITGIHEAVIEGHKGIIEFTDNVIRLNAPNFIMKIKGADFEITAVAEEYIAIKGIISGVEYQF